jgi:hypothetical protein
MRLSLIGHRQLLRTHSVKVVEIGVGFEVAIGQAAIGGSLAGLASINGGVSSANNKDGIGSRPNTSSRKTGHLWRL